MPKKIPGKHHLHIKIEESHFRTLQEYCNAGIERISATSILELFLNHYVRDYLAPRMKRGESATWDALKTDLPKATNLVARKIEPSAFGDK